MGDPSFDRIYFYLAACQSTTITVSCGFPESAFGSNPNRESRILVGLATATASLDSIGLGCP